MQLVVLAAMKLSVCLSLGEATESLGGLIIFFFSTFGELSFKLPCASGELFNLTARFLTDPSQVLHVSTYMMKERKNLHSAILVFHTNLHAAITATHISFDNSLTHQAS